MENVIARIVEIEQECATRIDEAARESQERILAHQRLIAGKKDVECARIVSVANARFEQASQEARSRIEAVGAQFRKAQARLYQDPALVIRIKEAIVSMLLSR